MCGFMEMPSSAETLLLLDKVTFTSYERANLTSTGGFQRRKMPSLTQSAMDDSDTCGDAFWNI